MDDPKNSKDPRVWVALILALSVLVFVIGGMAATFYKVFIGGSVTPEALTMWKEIILILVGSLATWLGTKK